MKWKTFIRIMKTFDPCADTKIARIRDIIEEETGIEQKLTGEAPLKYIYEILGREQKQ